MRIVVVSDIHGNLEALDAVLSDAARNGYDHLVCLGDVVGYGADPQACADKIREVVSKDEPGRGMIVRGNHDDAASGGGDEYFNPNARMAVRWTREQLDAETIDWLAQLPMTLVFQELFLVHSSPYRPRDWDYVTTREDALMAFKSFGQQIALIGHSHVPFHVSIGRDLAGLELHAGEHLALDDSRRYLSNVGSVGQPRDGDPRASYVIVDSGIRCIERIRVAYPIDTAAGKIREAGLPEFLADRLLKGR